VGASRPYRGVGLHAADQVRPPQLGAAHGDELEALVHRLADDFPAGDAAEQHHRIFAAARTRQASPRR
jgi:hypothetical protein